MSRNKMDAREGSPPHLDTFRQDLVTMNVRMERILEAQTSKVADAAAQAVRSQLEPVEQLIAQMQTQLLPLRHLQTSPLPGAVDAQELCIEPRSQSRLRSIAKKAFPRMLPPEEVCPPRMEQGIQTDAEAQPTHKHAKTHAILKEIGTGSIGLPWPRGSSGNEPIRVASTSAYHLDPSTLSPLRGMALFLVRHQCFEVMVMITLLASSFTLGLETHLNMQDVQAEPNVVFRIFDIVWCAAFLLELTLRFVADGFHFLSVLNPEFTWNLTDTVFVVLSTADELIVLLGFALELSQFRLLRMVRLVRVLRLLRVVRFCSELRIMVNGIAGSMKTLFWAMLLLGILMFIFGVTFMQLAYNHLRNTGIDIESSGLVTYYGTIGRSMLTLFMAISGGVDWRDAVAPLSAMSWIIDYFMGIYVFFTVFCFINVVTGIFVDNAKELGEQETLHQRAGQYLRRQRWVKEVVNLFAKMDVSSEGDLSYEEFMAEIKDERVQDCFRHLGINVENHTADELFELFDFDDDGKIDPFSFEQAIRQFHGTARSIDVYKIRRDTQKIGKQLHYLACALGCDAHRELLE